MDTVLQGQNPGRSVSLMSELLWHAREVVSVAKNVPSWFAKNTDIHAQDQRRQHPKDLYVVNWL